MDGAPLSDSDDVDGVPLDGAALLKKARRQADVEEDDDVDGVPREWGLGLGWENSMKIYMIMHHCQ